MCDASIPLNIVQKVIPYDYKKIISTNSDCFTDMCIYVIKKIFSKLYQTRFIQKIIFTRRYGFTDICTYICYKIGFLQVISDSFIILQKKNINNIVIVLQTCVYEYVIKEGFLQVVSEPFTIIQKIILTK